MQITWYGHSCFSFQNEKVTIVIDPHDGKTMGLRVPDVSADIVLMSHDHYDHNASGCIGGDHEDHKFHNGRFISHGVEFLGLDTYHDHHQGSKRGHNTVHVLKMDGISICHCGDLGCIPSEDVLDAMKGVDILMIPVGGFYTMGLEEVLKLIHIIGPKIVIPMHYHIDGLKIDEITGIEPFIDSISGRRIVNVRKTIDIDEKDIPEKDECWVFDY